MLLYKRQRGTMNWQPARKVSKLYSSTVARAFLGLQTHSATKESIRQRGCVILNHTTYYLNPQDPSFFGVPFFLCLLSQSSCLFYWNKSMTDYESRARASVAKWNDNRKDGVDQLGPLESYLRMNHDFNFTQVRIYGFERTNGIRNFTSHWIID